MDRAHWTSPSFRGRSPHPRHQNPRFRGEGGFGSPSRHFSPQHWQQRSPSPYRYQGQRGHGSSFSPHYHQNIHPYATSTPVHGGGRPFFRGGRGGRFNKRPSFGSQSFGKDGSANDIDNWISHEMWADPWRFLTGATSSSTPQVSNKNTHETEQGGTKFAGSDFNETSLEGERCTENTQPEKNDTKTKFAESDFDVTDSEIDLLETSRDVNTNKGRASENSTIDFHVKSSAAKSQQDAVDDDDEFEIFATDSVVLDNDDQLLS